MKNTIEEIGSMPGIPGGYVEPPYQIESGAYRFAVQELDILCKMYPTKDNPPIIKDFIHEILNLVNKFAHTGQSGNSAPYVANAIASAVKKLCTFQPICPITGFDEEWTDVREFGGGGDSMKYQNKRCSALFKDDQGNCWYLDAITWRNQHGSTWTGNATTVNGKKVTSRQYIKGFPFEPKTFVIDVIENEVAKDDWEFTVKDEKKLDEVFQYYDFYTPI